jgi:hypothetical protein
MRIAVLGTMMGLLVWSGSVSTTVSAQDQQPPATAPGSGVGDFGSLFAGPTTRGLGKWFTPSRQADPKASFLIKSPRLDQSEPRPADKPTVVCGMTLLPADPATDPGIRRVAPTDGQQFTMRSIDPGVCRQ